jgi:hypothetical protein
MRVLPVGRGDDSSVAAWPGGSGDFKAVLQGEWRKVQKRFLFWLIRFFRTQGVEHFNLQSLPPF